MAGDTNINIVLFFFLRVKFTVIIRVKFFV